ncbi:hypothetical protein LSTR_LSTR003392 [Laodelphax striatellus]|uniref:Nuclear pore complex protein Nup153 n=1 Tax=Laodelphax striatellus TaxID=195883 RepID=A0A482X5B6_LAOST|nr:hypothetical protein LSTR_LSTR003392 [Laodelphax striatellus]
MSKESSSIRSKKTHSAKPYDVSQSFVAKVASRFTGLNPRSLINRWLGPGEASGEPVHEAPSNFVNSHPIANLAQDVGSDEARPSKRPRLPVDSPFPTNKRFANVTANEEISPIGPVIGNDLAGEPGGSRQVNFSNMKKISTPRRAVKKMSAPSTITTQAIIENTEKFNGGDDCSESSESTSGCSSLVPQAQSSLQSRHNESRRLSSSGAGNLNGSLFPGRSSPKVDLSSLNRRRPSFNTTAFNSSRLFNSSAAMQTSQSSPFYSGRTMYGGASAYQSSTAGLFAPSPRRAGVTVRPVSTANSSATPALSATAKRILAVLEQFSTPVVDAKRVPVTPGSAKRKLNRYAELSVPQTSDLLRVKRRERLQDSTCAARQASISSSTPLSPPSSSAPAANLQYRLGNEGKSSQSSHIGKLKHNEEMEEQTVEDVRLPAAVLPIDKLPRIDIQVPPPPPNKTVFEIKSNQSSSLSLPLSKAPAASGNFPISNHFKFSKPAPAQIENSRLNSEGKESFVFSEPCKWSEEPSEKNDSAKSKVMPDSGVGMGKGFSVSKVSSPNNSKASEMPVATSVVDSRTSNHKDSSNWKCSTCMVKNSEDSSKCSACGTCRTETSSVVASPLVFKVPADTWQCKECFIRNKNAVNACAACTTPKPSASKPPQSTTPQTSSATTSTTVNSFGDKFKMPTNKWECKECFVRNEDTAQKCVACCTPKPGAAPETKKPDVGFGNMFKKPQGSWECGSCMIQNKPDCTKCIACETPKPGTKAEKPAATPAFSFGNPITIEGAGQVTFGFGSNNSSTPKTESTSATSNFVFGATNSSATNAKFTFGVPPANTSDNSDTAPKEKKVKSPEKVSNPLQELEKLQQKQAADTTVPFKFGSTVNHSNADNKSSTLPATNSADAMFKSTAKQEADAPAKPAVPNFMFGSSNTSKHSEQVVTNFFAQSSEPAKTSNVASEPEKFSSTSVPGAMFGGTDKPISNLFSFGSSNSSASNDKKAPVFGNAKPAAESVEPAKPTPLFGASSSSSMFMPPATEQKNALFGGVSDAKSVLGNVSSTTVPAFGVQQAPAASEPVKQFGQTSATSTASAGFNFGSAAASSPFQTTEDKSKQQSTSLFSMQPAAGGAAQQPTGFGFGAPPAAAEPAKPSAAFTFGASSAQPAPAAPAASSAFAFGAAAAAPAQSFNFTPKESEQPRPAFQFNAGASAAPTPAFGVQPPPAFGSSESQPPPQPAAFSFGGTAPAPAPTPNTNLFGFGAQSDHSVYTRVYYYWETHQESVPKNWSSE